jgi:hypothetical protein
VIFADGIGHGGRRSKYFEQIRGIGFSMEITPWLHVVQSERS